MKVEIVSEEIKFMGENQVILMTVKSDVDISSFRERVMQIKSDRGLEQKVIDQQRQLQGLEDNLKKLQQQLTTTNIDEVVTLRKERVDAFGKMDDLEKIKFDIKRSTTSAVQNVEIGMTVDEVIKLIGKPRIDPPFPYKHLNYGNVWVVIENGLVTILVDSRCFKPSNSRDNYFNFFNPCGAGKGLIKY